jgi:HSP20 family protein
MSLVRWDPFAEVDGMFNRMLPGRWPRLTIEGESGVSFEWSPPADISENDKEYLIRAELPGMKREDVKVTVGDGVLTIQGERRQKKEDKSERFHRVETRYGSFTRTFSLPDNVKSEAISCESKEGVLTVRIPKSEQKKPKEISIQ